MGFQALIQGTGKAGVLVCMAALLFAVGCDDLSTDAAVDVLDPFPQPVGEKIIPLESQPRYSYQYARLDTTEKVVQRERRFPLYVSQIDTNTYTYAVEDTSRGHILWWRQAPRDSMGIYVIGFFQSGLHHYTQRMLWLPQEPENFGTWNFGARHMEWLASDTLLVTRAFFPDSALDAPGSEGFQRNSTILIRETLADTVTYYHFAKGVGMVAFRRYHGNRLHATGEIIDFYRLNRYGYY